MSFRQMIGVKTDCVARHIAPLLMLFALLLGSVSTAQAQSPSQINCSDAPYNGTIDGNFVQPAPDNVKLDTNCTIRNYPGGMSTNFSFDNNDPTPYLIIFDNVLHTGQMSCNAVAGHKLWFANTSSTNIHPNCQNLLIPVEKIDKQSPGLFASIGVPFTYQLTIPVLFDPASGGVIKSDGSVNDLHSIVITDDLNAIGADLSYVSHAVYWQGDASRTPIPHSFSNSGGLLTFNFGTLVVPADDQFIIELTVVLNDSPANVIGTTFVNTAKWQFGRLIDSTFYTPLPGEWGISQPMTIGAPSLTVTKSGPATMNAGAWGQFTVDAQNTGSSNAWDITLLDMLPDGATGGMCDLTPEILSVTLAGTPLTQGTGYSIAYTGPPTCRLTLTLLDAAGAIAPGQHLIVTYRTKLDANSQNGIALTNVAGATRWFNGSSGNSARVGYTRTLTNGTVGTADFQDAHTTTVALAGYFFEKTVTNLRTGEYPATIAASGDTLRYTLRVQTTTAALNNFSIYDELDALNTPAGFVPGTLTLVSALPPGAIDNSNSTGGAQGTGVINIGNLNLAAGSQVLIQFDIQVAANVTPGSYLTNQAQLLVNGSSFTVSDDPYVNGQSDPLLSGDEDPTRVLVNLPTLTFYKTLLTGATANPGDVVRYRLQLINVSNIPFSGYSLRDDIDALNANAMFVPGTLTLVSVLPAGATNNSNINGGSKGTGLLDIRNLSIGIAGSANDTITVEFTARLVPVIANGTIVLNQAQLAVLGTQLQRSDDPALGGTEDPTPLVIQSAPVFRVLKTSQDMTGDAVLRAGDRLRYTITVKNVGNANATDASLRDQIPVNTTYVAGSTRLNGVIVADSGNISALANGMPINAPENSTPGLMRADASATTANVATITFDVVVDTDAADGTVISNQGFVSALAASIVDYPSDDPATPIVNDPTRNVVGYLPLVYADKRAVLQVDGGTPGVIDPDDVLRYTITVYNTGTIAATGAVLRDQVPANTTYVADSTTLNGLAVSRPDSGVSPLVAGVNISSSDLTPPVPGAGQGTLSPGRSAVIQFDLRVNAGVATGTLISNQAVVITEQLPQLLTDGDGNPATGPEPTVVVVGSGQQVSITKQVAVVGGGAAIAGAQLEYQVRVTNISTVPAYYVVITDDLNANAPGYLTLVNQSATLNASTTGVTVAGAVITADYFANYGPLQPGQSAVLRFRATINPTLVIGTRVTNTGVVTWNNPPQTARASVSIDVGGVVGVGVLNGTVWHDANFNKTADTSELLLEGWSVELYRNSRRVFTTLTDASGTYRISGIAPNYATADTYELRFTAPGAGTNTAKLGYAYSQFTNDLQRISAIVVQAGNNLQDLNLPIEPNGVVYDSISRVAMPGVVLTLLNAASRTALPSSCFYDSAQQDQVTLVSGYYRFDINFSDPSCASGGSYLIEVTAPASGYIAGPSQIIPPASSATTAALSVPTCPGGLDDAVPATAQRCEVQVSEFAPPPAVRARSAGTKYHLHLLLDNSLIPGSSQIFNNHIPLDPDLQGAIAITKTALQLNVTRSQLVPYVITYKNVTEVPLFDVNLVDRFPAGFRYVKGSARLDGVAIEPTVVGRQLIWPELAVDASSQHTLKLLLAVGAGVSEGEFVNHVQALHAFTSNALSPDATATVRVVPDPTFDCTDVTGKVFDDINRNGAQEAGERGLPGVRLATVSGLVVTTDAYGRFHITCAVVPREGRGSNFILKLDDRTLPSGYRLSTDQVLVERATRGKALRFNYGASIYRVIGLDIADAVFEPGTTNMREQWQPRVTLLLDELKNSPAVLRLSYLADIEDEHLVEQRMSAMKNEIMRAWTALNCCYQLTIEPQVFWRLGAPPTQNPARKSSAGELE